MSYGANFQPQPQVPAPTPVGRSFSEMIADAGLDYSQKIQMGGGTYDGADWSQLPDGGWTAYDPRYDAVHSGMTDNLHTERYSPGEGAAAYGAMGTGHLSPMENISGGRGFTPSILSGSGLSASRAVTPAPFTLPKLPSMGGMPSAPSMDLAQYMNSNQVKTAVAEMINNANRPIKQNIRGRKKDLKQESSVISDLSQSRREGLGQISRDTERRAAESQERLKAAAQDGADAHEQTLDRITKLLVGNPESKNEIAQDQLDSDKLVQGNSKINREQVEGQVARRGSLLDEYQAAAHQKEAGDLEYARKQSKDDIGKYRDELSNNSAMSSQFARELGNQMLSQGLAKYQAEMQAAAAANNQAMQVASFNQNRALQQRTIDQEAAERAMYGGNTLAENLQIRAQEIEELKLRAASGDREAQVKLSAMMADGSTEISMTGGVNEVLGPWQQIQGQ